MNATLDDDILYGLSERHLSKSDDGHLLNLAMLDAFAALKASASQAGFDLKVASSYRSFERQLAIWNGKFSGKRTILDSNNQPVDITSLNDWQTCQAILLFSALPGGSRHHWGCDFDYYDGAGLPEDYALQLIEDEYTGQGPCSGLHRWLTQNAAQFDFFFPYREFNGGIAKEPWHLSYRPLAQKYLAEITPEGLVKRIEQSDILGKASIIKHIDEIFSRYIRNICGD